MDILKFLSEISTPLNYCQVVAIGESHFETKDTKYVLDILNKMSKIQGRKLCFYMEYFSSGLPDDFDPDINDLAELSLANYYATDYFAQYLQEATPALIDNDALLSDLTWKKLATNLGVAKTPDFATKAEKIIKVLQFAQKNKVLVYGMDLPGSPVHPPLSAGDDRLEIYKKKFDFWNAGRDPWMAKQIDDFINNHAGTKDTLVCFIGADHSKGLMYGNRITIYFKPFAEGKGMFKGIKNHEKLATLSYTEGASSGFNIVKLSKNEYQYKIG